MGTNFYARRIPTVKQKEELIEAINNNNFESINWEQGQRINVGDQFLCIQDVIMYDDRELCYKEGDIYTSECDGCITNLQGDKKHEWDGVEYFNEYFKRLK